MTTRRDLLKHAGLGAAAVAVMGASGRAAHAAHTDTLRAMASGGEGAAPWWLVAPLTAGAVAGLGWTVRDLTPVHQGAAVLSLEKTVLTLEKAVHSAETGDGRQVARVHICSRSGRARGLAHTELFDLVLMDGADGDRRTSEDLARVIVNLARRVRKHELREWADLQSVGRMLSHAERVALFGPDQLG